ncbi:MAG: sigma factor-like helix-turn-helix DNA-binding protein [Bradymonadia bacterium]
MSSAEFSLEIQEAPPREGRGAGAGYKVAGRSSTRRPPRRSAHRGLEGPVQTAFNFDVRRVQKNRQPRTRSVKTKSRTWRTISASEARSYFEQVDDDHLGHEQLPTKPRTRAECDSVPRPCPFVSCKYNLAIRLSDGDIRFSSAHTGHSHGDQRTPYQRLEELINNVVDGVHGTNCALDYADRVAKGDQMSTESVGKVLGYTREMVRQIQKSGLQKIRASLAEMGFAGDIKWEDEAA